MRDLSQIGDYLAIRIAIKSVPYSRIIFYYQINSCFKLMAQNVSSILKILSRKKGGRRSLVAYNRLGTSNE